MRTWQGPWSSESRREAVVALLRLPDPPDLPKRAYSLRLEGDRVRQIEYRAELARQQYLKVRTHRKG